MESILTTKPVQKKKEKILVELEDGKTWKESGVYQKTVNQKPPDNSWQLLGMAQQIGFTIALPIAAGAIAGSYLDKKFGGYPKMTLGLIMIGVAISVFGFVRIIIHILKDQK